VSDLLFKLATWHGLAKLRLHTESTIRALDTSTTRLGKLLQHFATSTCKAYETRALPSEEAARGRRIAALAAKRQVPDLADQKVRKSKAKQFNLNTYKFHSLGAYVKAIQMYGTTDNYTTQPVSASIVFVFCFLPFHRESLNTDVSSVSIHEHTRVNILEALVNNNNGNESCTEWHSQRRLIQM
jgi:hypothetical protein